MNSDNPTSNTIKRINFNDCRYNVELEHVVVT